MRKNFKPRVKNFVEDCLASGITSPSEMRDAFKNKYGKELTIEAFIMAMKRKGVTKVQRKEIAEKSLRQIHVKDIMEYQQVKNYLRMAELGAVQQDTIHYTKKYLRDLWEWMGYSNPETWTFEALIDCIKQHIAMTTDDRGRMVFEHSGKVRYLLGAFNTCFPNILGNGWSNGLRREAGELKDYFTFEEFNAFIEALENTPQMSREGWIALYKAQVNGAFREGTKGNTGILSLRWENIDYSSRRCSVREKGSRGKAGRLWKNVPLDLFPWLNGWDDLMLWWELRGKPTIGKVFPICYQYYRVQFHTTRKKCNSRISGNSETMRPHVLRMTHAQWCVKLWIPIEQICGVFPDGWFGVGWDNPMVLLKYYITLETEQREKAEVIMKERMEKLGLAPLSAWEKATLETVAFNPRLEESHKLLCRIVE